MQVSKPERFVNCQVSLRNIACRRIIRAYVSSIKDVGIQKKRAMTGTNLDPKNIMLGNVR